YRHNIACGFIHPEDDLSRLKALYVPHWLKWTDAWTARIETFAKAGGTVILGGRTGSRDVNNHVIRGPTIRTQDRECAGDCGAPLRTAQDRARHCGHRPLGQPLRRGPDGDDV